MHTCLDHLKKFIMTDFLWIYIIRQDAYTCTCNIVFCTTGIYVLCRMGSVVWSEQKPCQSVNHTRQTCQWKVPYIYGVRGEVYRQLREVQYVYIERRCRVGKRGGLAKSWMFERSYCMLALHSQYLVLSSRLKPGQHLLTTQNSRRTLVHSPTCCSILRSLEMALREQVCMYRCTCVHVCAVN